MNCSSPARPGACAEVRALAAQLLGDRGGDEVVLGREVGVEGAVGQPGVRHQRGDARSVDAVSLEPAAGRLDDPPSRRLLVVFAVPRHAFLHSPRARLPSLHPPYGFTIYYDRNSKGSGVTMKAAQPVALVTGATSGIGKAAALALVEAGFEVVGTSRDAGRRPARRRDVPRSRRRRRRVGHGRGRAGDRPVRAARRPGQQRRYRVGGRRRGTLGGAGPERVRHQRLRRDPDDEGGPAAHARPGRRPHHQHLVGAGFAPQPYMAVYVASKHAVEGYSESVDHEVREHGVRVLLVEPATPAPRSTRTLAARRPAAGLRQARHIFDDILAAAIKTGRPGRRRQGDRRGSHRPETEAPLHRRPRPGASARCAASPPPGPSTSRSARSTAWPADRRRPSHHPGER